LWKKRGIAQGPEKNKRKQVHSQKSIATERNRNSGTVEAILKGKSGTSGG
jgi:hypothetical protein